MQVVKAPDPRLRITTRPIKKITTSLFQTLKDMIKLTKTFKDPEGVGLAATQVGLTEKFFVAKFGNEFKAFINPEIISTSKTTKQYFEGCLSIPTVWGETQRHISIKVRYTTVEGKVVEEQLKGLKAWFFQHEVDHLNGILMPDRVMQSKGRFFKCTGKDKAGSDIFEEMVI